MYFLPFYDIVPYPDFLFLWPLQKNIEVIFKIQAKLQLLFTEHIFK